MKLYTVNPSVSRSADTSPYTGEALGVRRTYYAFAKGSATPTGDHQLDLKILLLLCLAKKKKAAFLRLFFVVETHGLEPWTSCV